MSNSSVSQSIRALEDRLNLRLLNRTTRSCSLTEAGAHLLARVQPALAELDGAFETLNAFRAEPVGALKLSVSDLALSMIVAPMLARFLADHPAIRVEVTISDQADLGPGLDAGIRSQTYIPQDMVAVRVGEPSRFLAVAAPAYLAAHGGPERPGDLARHNCIRFRVRSGGLYPWLFEEEGRKHEPAVTGSLVTDNGALMLSAAAQGAGIAYVIETYARPYLETGALVPLLQAHAVPFPGFFLYYPSRRHVPAPLRVFADVLTAAGRTPANDQPRRADRRPGAPSLSAPAE